MPRDHVTILAGMGAELILLAFKFFVYLFFLAVLGLRCHAGFSLKSWGEQWLLSGCRAQLLTAAASLVAERGL